MRGRSVEAPRTLTVELADAPGVGDRAIPIGADTEREDAHVLAAGFDPRRSPRSTSVSGSYRTRSRRGVKRRSSKAAS
jgi:hypothetical protein